VTVKLPGIVFLDRDGTVMVDTEYPRDPALVELVHGAAESLARLNEAGVPVVIVTNQSGIARGLLTEDDYRRVQARMEELLADRGARIDGSYHCPHHPDVTGPCDCRKPATGLFEQAAAELGADLATAAFVGDRWRDVGPARKYGARGILVQAPSSPAEEVEQARAEFDVVPSIAAAVEMLLNPPAST
jgi:D-glycero-D-manno-heptose 1,7-bisphosphate phosphatase